MSFLEDLNGWIAVHQALVVSLGIPLFTIFTGFIGSILIHKAKLDEVRIIGRTKLADFRMENHRELASSIDVLLQEVSEFLTLKIQSENGERDFQFELGHLRNIIRSSEKVMLRITSDNSLQDELITKIKKCIDRLSTSNPSLDTPTHGDLREVCRKILTSERQQVERELKNLA